MDKAWLKRHRRKIKKTLHRWKKLGADDREALSQYPKLVSLYLINLGSRKTKGLKKKEKARLKEPPVSGEAIYYAELDGDEVNIIYPWNLDSVRISRRQFERSITQIWWPNEKCEMNPSASVNKYLQYCNRFNIAEAMLKKMADLASRGKNFNQKLVRKAIADLKEVKLDEVPKYKIRDALDNLKKWQQSDERQFLMRYKEQADSLLEKWESIIKGDEKQMAKKKKHDEESEESSTVSSSAASDSEDSEESSKASSSSSEDSDKVSKKKKGKKKTGKKEKPAKKGKKEKGKKSVGGEEIGGYKVPRGAATAAPVMIRLLLKKKGKKVDLDALNKAVQEAKGKKSEIPESKMNKAIKKVKKWAEKSELKFKASSNSLQLG